MALPAERTLYHGSRLSMSQLRYQLQICWHTLARWKRLGMLCESTIDAHLRRRDRLTGIMGKVSATAAAVAEEAR